MHSMAYYLFTQLLISKNPIRKASGKMNFFSPRVNLMWINFSFLLILTTVPLPNFLCMTVLSTANVSNWVLRSISALLGAAEDVGGEGAADLAGSGWTMDVDLGLSTFIAVLCCSVRFSSTISLLLEYAL